MSDSVRPHRRQPTRLPCPKDSPGKSGLPFPSPMKKEMDMSKYTCDHTQGQVWESSRKGPDWVTGPATTISLVFFRWSRVHSQNESSQLLEFPPVRVWEGTAGASPPHCELSSPLYLLGFFPASQRSSPFFMSCSSSVSSNLSKRWRSERGKDMSGRSHLCWTSTKIFWEMNSSE